MAKLLENQTELEVGARVSGHGNQVTSLALIKDLQSFELAVVQPRKGKPGRVVFTATIHGHNVSDAVRVLRDQINGSGWIVIQKAAVEQVATSDNTMTAALRRAYNG